MKDEITLCSHCHSMTHSIRKGRANYVCGKCKGDKSLTEFFLWELENT